MQEDSAILNVNADGCYEKIRWHSGERWAQWADEADSLETSEATSSYTRNLQFVCLYRHAKYVMLYSLAFVKKNKNGTGM